MSHLHATKGNDRHKLITDVHFIYPILTLTTLTVNIFKQFITLLVTNLHTSLINRKNTAANSDVTEDVASPVPAAGVASPVPAAYHDARWP